jgi:membrane protein
MHCGKTQRVRRSTDSQAFREREDRTVSVVDVSARIDGYQQRHAWMAFPLAVRQKYAEDRGGYVAAAVTYYAFFSLFPLLIVAATLLGFVVHGDPELQERLARTALGQIPLIGRDLRVHALNGSPTALVLSLAASLWAGTRVFIAFEAAAESIWYLRDTRFSGYLRARLRALELLVVIGGGALLTTALTGARAAAGKGGPTSSALLLVSLTADFGLFWVASRLLAPADVDWRQLIPGAAVGGGAWALLQQVGDVFVSRVLANASATYGTFATVIGLLSFTYVAVTIALVAMEINVVAVRGLWPRSFSPFQAAAPTPGDDRAAALRIKAAGAEFPQRVGALADASTRPAARKSGSSIPRRRSSMNTLLQQTEKQMQRMRWALGLSGALSVALGVVIIIWPNISLYSLVLVFGAFTLARGVLGLGVAIGGRVTQGRGWLVLSSLASIAVGVLVFFWTDMSALALLYVIGAYAITLGIISIGGAFWLPLDGGDRALLTVTGIVSIVFGIVMFAKPGDGALVLLALIAAYALIVGISELVVAIGGKRLFERALRSYVTPATRPSEPQASH